MGKTTELKFIGEQLYETEINTLRVYYIPKKDFTNSFAILTSDFGSADVEFSVDGGVNYKRYPEGIAHFLEHKMFEMPGGENIFNKFTELDLQECYDAFYNPRNMILVLSGDLQIATFEKIIKDMVKPGKDVHLVKKVYLEPATSNSPGTTIEMDLQVPNYLFGLKVIPSQGDLLKESLIGSLVTKLVFGSTSEFYEENLRNGKINDSFSSGMSLDKDHGEIFLGGESKTPEDTLNLVEGYISQEDKDFFKDMEKDLSRIKKAMIGSFVNIFNNVTKIGTTTTSLLLEGENIFAYADILQKITLDDVDQKFRVLYDLKHSTKVIIK